MTTITKNYVGVDVSKHSLDIHIHPLGKFFKIDNTESAIKQLIKEFAQYEIAQIACEATGGYEKLLAKLLQCNFYNLWIIDPRRIKGFIIARGCKSKTDKIDAKKIAEFTAQNKQDYEVIAKTTVQEKIQALVNRKQDLTKFLGAEKARLKHPSHALYIPSIKKLIKVFEREIKSIDQQIKTFIQSDIELSTNAKYLESIPGIGQSSAALLLSHVPELGKISNKKISALVGVCPYVKQSGAYKGKSFIRGGRIPPRNALYMCALTTIKYNLVLKEFYDRLIDKKKPFKVAIVAVMHKLIILANSVLKKGKLCEV